MHRIGQNIRFIPSATYPLLHPSAAHSVQTCRPAHPRVLRRKTFWVYWSIIESVGRVPHFSVGSIGRPSYSQSCRTVMPIQNSGSPIVMRVGEDEINDEEKEGDGVKSNQRRRYPNARDRRVEIWPHSAFLCSNSTARSLPVANELD